MKPQLPWGRGQSSEEPAENVDAAPEAVEASLEADVQVNEIDERTALREYDQVDPSVQHRTEVQNESQAIGDPYQQQPPTAHSMGEQGAPTRPVARDAALEPFGQADGLGPERIPRSSSQQSPPPIPNSPSQATQVDERISAHDPAAAGSMSRPREGVEALDQGVPPPRRPEIVPYTRSVHQQDTPAAPSQDSKVFALSDSKPEPESATDSAHRELEPRGVPNPAPEISQPSPARNVWTTLFQRNSEPPQELLDQLEALSHEKNALSLQIDALTVKLSEKRSIIEVLVEDRDDLQRRVDELDQAIREPEADRFNVGLSHADLVNQLGRLRGRVEKLASRVFDGAESEEGDFVCTCHWLAQYCFNPYQSTDPQGELHQLAAQLRMSRTQLEELYQTRMDCLQFLAQMSKSDPPGRLIWLEEPRVIDQHGDRQLQSHSNLATMLPGYVIEQVRLDPEFGEVAAVEDSDPSSQDQSNSEEAAETGKKKKQKGRRGFLGRRKKRKD